MKLLKDQKGDFTINGALLLLLVMLLLVLFLSGLSVGIQSAKLNAAAAELTRYIEIRGKVDAAVTTELKRLEESLGRDLNLSIDADYLSSSAKTIQFGDAFTVTLTEQISVGAGGILSIPITLTANSPGRSEQYWKS